MSATTRWEKDINIIRGKNIVRHTTGADVDKLFEYIDLLEEKLDEYENDDTFGTEGWRHAFGIDV